MSEKRVVDDRQAHRFEVFVDDELAGYSEYREEDGALAFTHTVVESGFEGQGVGSALAGGALDSVRGAGMHLLPYCPFIRAFVQRHPDYLDLVPVARRHEFALPPGDRRPDNL